jgi:cytochrome bd-type quinol oxidase subunit 2
MKLRNRYILFNIIFTFVLGTVLRIIGLDSFMDENIPIDLSFMVFSLISLLISTYGLWRVKELRSLDPNDRKLYILVSSILLLVLGRFISDLVILPFLWPYCSNNIC